MALKIFDTYLARSNVADNNYPTGSFKNESVPGNSNDGTPLEKAWANDFLGARDSLLNEANVIADGQADKVGSSQWLEALIKVIHQNSQFAPYSSSRTYKTGEICYIVENDEVKLMQMYSNRQSLGNAPVAANRHDGWRDKTRPFWWIPYTGGRIGMPFYWLQNTSPEEAIMELNVNLPIKVYWRLAKVYPHLVNGSNINTGEIRGEFLRVLDNGRGIDGGRHLNSQQGDTIRNIKGSTTVGRNYLIPGNPDIANNGAISHGYVNNQTHGEGTFKIGTTNWNTGGVSFDASRVVPTSNENRPRNVARSMAIFI